MDFISFVEQLSRVNGLLFSFIFTFWDLKIWDAFNPTIKLFYLNNLIFLKTQNSWDCDILNLLVTCFVWTSPNKDKIKSPHAYHNFPWQCDIMTYFVRLWHGRYPTVASSHEPWLADLGIRNQDHGLSTYYCITP